MCGIAGFVGCDRLDREAPRRALRMRDVMQYRGPDEAGLHCDDFAALAHRRLSIVDLSTGQQPLSNEDGTIWVIYNGEIYNHGDVRPELESHGHRYRTKSDTEMIVHAYEQWGDDCVHRFRGMFAFAIWDAPKRRLLLSRDRLGIKPLYWCRAGNTLLFGSEIKAILASGLVPADPNYAVLPEVLSTRYTSGEETLFKGIYKLLPGHQLVFELGEIRVRQYWDVPVGERSERSRSAESLAPHSGGHASLSGESGRDVVDQFRSLLTESVRLRLMSDVPLGMFLSGGIDSSAVAALMAGLIDRPLQTFSIAFKERAFNELEYAREVARTIGAESHEVVIDDADFFGALPKLVWHEDEPIAHPSSVPLYYVSALARQHVTVVLTGEGSDELMAGYGKYLRLAWNWRAGTVYERAVPRGVRNLVASRIVPHVPGLVGRYARRSFLAMDRTPEAMFLDNFAAIRLSDQQRLLAPAFRDGATKSNAYGPSLDYFERPNGSSTLLDRLLYADIKTYLVELLMKQDQMSMAASIESRVPFLDQRVVETAAATPSRFKLAGWRTKALLREAVRDLVPAPILARRKMGFPVPLDGWLRGRFRPVVEEFVLGPRALRRGLFVPGALRRLVAEHDAGVGRHADRLWLLINLELWQRVFIDGEDVRIGRAC